MSNCEWFAQIAHLLIFGQKISDSLWKPMSELSALLLMGYLLCWACWWSTFTDSFSLLFPLLCPMWSNILKQKSLLNRFCLFIWRPGWFFFRFPSESLFFCQKMSKWAICSKKQLFTHSLIFGERPEWFAHDAHFWWATGTICSHCSPKKREWANHSFF